MIVKTQIIITIQSIKKNYFVQVTYSHIHNMLHFTINY